MLAKAGLLHSGRGAQGGYRLAREPKAYTVGEILRLTEGNLAPVACLAGAENRCELCGECSTLDFWAGLYATVNEYLDRYTLADLLKERQRKLKKKQIVLISKSNRTFQQKSGIFPPFRVKLCSRYPNSEQFDE